MRIFNDITSSFYSSAFYAELAHARKGIGMRYVMALTIITTLLITGFLVFYKDTLNKYAAEVPEFAAQLPSVVIKDGKLTIDKPSPYIVPIGKGDDRLNIYIDTNYKVNDLPSLKDYMGKNRIIVLATATEIITIKKGDKIEINSFSEMKKDATISHADWKNIATFISEKGVSMLTWFVFFSSLIGLFFYHLIATFLCAIVMLLLSLLTRANLDFSAAMRLTSALRMPYYAIIYAPLMLGGAALSGIVNWLVWLGYMIFAASGSKRVA